MTPEILAPRFSFPPAFYPSDIYATFLAPGFEHTFGTHDYIHTFGTQVREHFWRPYKETFLAPMLGHIFGTHVRTHFWHPYIDTVEPRNSELQFSGKPRNSEQFSNDQLFIK